MGYEMGRRAAGKIHMYSYMGRTSGVGTRRRDGNSVVGLGSWLLVWACWGRVLGRRDWGILGIDAAIGRENA